MITLFYCSSLHFYLLKLLNSKSNITVCYAYRYSQKNILLKFGLLIENEKLIYVYSVRIMGNILKIM